MRNLSQLLALNCARVVPNSLFPLSHLTFPSLTFPLPSSTFPFPSIGTLSRAFDQCYLSVSQFLNTNGHFWPHKTRRFDTTNHLSSTTQTNNVWNIFNFSYRFWEFLDIFWHLRIISLIWWKGESNCNQASD